MKKHSLTLGFGAVALALALPHGLLACENVFVKSVNSTGGAMGVALSMNSSVPVQTTFSLDASGSRIDDLVVSPESPNPLKISATVNAGGMQTQCSIDVVNENIGGQCAGVNDPKLVLAVQMTEGEVVTTPGKKHDNGNHKGEYKLLGKVVGVDVPLHSGKPAERIKNDKKTGGSTTTTTPGTLKCSFGAVASF
jgi:hypothetical protein